VWVRMEELWREMGKEYIGILAEMKRVEAVDMMIREDFISFLSVVLSVMLIFKRMADILGCGL
jgi:hypothetical protein